MIDVEDRGHALSNLTHDPELLSSTLLCVKELGVFNGDGRLVRHARKHLQVEIGEATPLIAGVNLDHAQRLPVSKNLEDFCGRFGFDPVQYVLAGGEDYTLLCTVAPEIAEETEAKFQAEFKKPLFRIGEITDRNRLELIFPDGRIKSLVSTGWNHFKTG